MDMSLRRLRILREVAHHGGVTTAAHEMQYSPSGISQQMSVLEEEVGAPVLERRGRGIGLTEVGRVLLEHAEILLTAERELQAAVEEARDTLAVELSVGVFSTVAAGLMPGIIKDLSERHPQIHLRTREIDPDDASLQVRHGHLDLAFLIDYPDATEPWATGITMVTAGHDELHLAAPAGAFSSAKVRLADLADHDWVMSGPRTYYGRAVRSACRQAGFDIRITHEVDEQATALAMVASGLGVTLMSDLGRAFLPDTGVEVFDLTRPLRRQILLAHDVGAGGRPAIKAFLKSTKRVAGSVMQGRAPRGPSPLEQSRPQG
ncbi:MAG: LysR substrate-binding domain-containing protein [Marmoricola sp.]